MAYQNLSSSAADMTRSYYSRRYPYTPVFHHSPEELDVIKRKFARWYALFTFLTLVFLAAFTAAFGWVLHYIYAAAFRFLLPQPLFLYSWPVFCIPGLFFACATIMYPLEGLQRMLMGDKYEVYNDYYFTTQGYDGNKANRHFTRLFLLISIVVLLPFATSFISIGGAYFKVRQCYQLLPHTYETRHVKNITYYKSYTDAHNRKHYAPHYKVKFYDGEGLNTINWTFNDSVITSFINTLCTSGIPMDTIDVHIHGASASGDDRDP